MVAGQGLTDGGNKIRAQVRFCDVAKRSFGEARVHKGSLVMNRQKHELGSRASLTELMGSLDPGEEWHGYVRNNNVRLKP